VSRRVLVFSVSLSVLLLAACAAKERPARPAKKDSATITTNAWRQGEYASVGLVSLDGQPLGEPTPPAPPTGKDAKTQRPGGLTNVRVPPGRHELGLRFAPVSVRRLDDPKQELPAYLDAPPALHSIAFDSEAGKTYVVRSRTWIRPDPDVPYGDYPPEFLKGGLAVVPVKARCDVVWVVEDKSKDLVACATFPDGCMSCEKAVPPAP
jgi:hypothetical protein